MTLVVLGGFAAKIPHRLLWSPAAPSFTAKPQCTTGSPRPICHPPIPWVSAQVLPATLNEFVWNTLSTPTLDSIS